MAKSYNQILPEILNLSRKEQYPYLLRTSEWINFRHKILQCSYHRCVTCKRKEGPIIAPIVEGELWPEYEKIKKHNIEFQKFSKTHPEEIVKQLLSGTYEGMWPYPATDKMVGHVVLQVHHKIYFLNKLPWEYQVSNLMALCAECHKNVHDSNVIYTYRDESLEYRREELRCKKCHGTGYLKQFDYYQDGICFECGGIGLVDNGTCKWEDEF